MSEQVKEDILKPLKQANQPMYIKEIAASTPYSRKTVEKYIPQLQQSNKIHKVREIGNSKLFEIKTE